MRVVTRILSKHAQKAAWSRGLPPIWVLLARPGLESLPHPGTPDDSSCSGRFVPAILLAFQQKFTGYKDVEESLLLLEWWWRWRRRQMNTLKVMTCTYCWLFTRRKRQSISIVSPSAKIATWRYWFCLSRDVYGGERSFTSYNKTKTVEPAVCCLLTQLDDGDSQQVTVSKYLNTVQDQK